MTATPVVLLLGVSGVGKTWLAKRVALARPDALCLSAGALLSASLHKTRNALRIASKEDVLQHQTALVDALKLARAENPGRPVLLEAHAFIDNDRELVDIPITVLRNLEVSGMIVAISPPAVIATRRAADRDRNRPRRSTSDLRRQQSHLLKIVSTYANALSARIEIVDASNVELIIKIFNLMTRMFDD